MKASELRDLTAEELNTRERELRAQLFDLKVKHNTGVLESTVDLGKLRRDLARLLGVRNELYRKLNPEKRK